VLFDPAKVSAICPFAMSLLWRQENDVACWVKKSLLPLSFGTITALRKMDRFSIPEAVHFVLLLAGGLVLPDVEHLPPLHIDINQVESLLEGLLRESCHDIFRDSVKLFIVALKCHAYNSVELKPVRAAAYEILRRFHPETAYTASCSADVHVAAEWMNMRMNEPYPASQDEWTDSEWRMTTCLDAVALDPHAAANHRLPEHTGQFLQSMRGMWKDDICQRTFPFDSRPRARVRSRLPDLILLKCSRRFTQPVPPKGSIRNTSGDCIGWNGALACSVACLLYHHILRLDMLEEEQRALTDFQTQPWCLALRTIMQTSRSAGPREIMPLLTVIEQLCHTILLTISVPGRGVLQVTLSDQPYIEGLMLTTEQLMGTAPIDAAIQIETYTHEALALVAAVQFIMETQHARRKHVY
jgi:hypothetical protein